MKRETLTGVTSRPAVRDVSAQPSSVRDVWNASRGSPIFVLDEPLTLSLRDVSFSVFFSRDSFLSFLQSSRTLLTPLTEQFSDSARHLTLSKSHARRLNLYIRNDLFRRNLSNRVTHITGLFLR